MRLTAGGIRELHWHNAAEWVLMLSGNARITAIDNDGKSAVKDVAKDDLWFFPTGTPHSIQGLEPDGCEFLPVKKYNEYLQRSDRKRPRQAKQNHQPSNSDRTSSRCV